MEHQGFDGQMRISNTLDAVSLSEVDIMVQVSEENGTPVPITTNPEDLSAEPTIFRNPTGNNGVKARDVIIEAL